MDSTYVKSFILYTNQAGYLKRLSNEEAGQVIIAIFDYIETGTLPNLGLLPDMVFSFIVDTIKRDKVKYEAICKKRRDAINKRWHTNEYISIKDNTKNTNESFVNPCINLNYDNDNDNESDNESESERKEDGTKAPTLSEKKFIKPLIQDIQTYCSQRNNNIDPENFYSFYESKGWLIGKTPMKYWKAAVRTWENRDRDKNNNIPTQNYGVEL